MSRALLFVFVACVAQAQTPKLSFEVVSIKPTKETMMSLIQAGKSFSTHDKAQLTENAADLRYLIQEAYRLPLDQITGADHLPQDRYEIHAKLPEGATEEQIPEMLQSMLAERFGLRVHHEEKVRPVYFLKLGKSTPKIQEITQPDPDKAGCNGGFRKNCQVTAEEFAQFLSMGARMQSAMAQTNSVALDRPVIDRTELKGTYSFVFQSGRSMGGGRRGGVDGNVTGDPDAAITIEEAVKSLGFVLESGKRAYDTLVIDHFERTPKDN